MHWIRTASIFVAFAAAADRAQADIPIGFNSALTGPMPGWASRIWRALSWRSPTSTPRAGFWASHCS
jgi:hypothetical protein